MDRYVRQLLEDIRWARDNVPTPWWRFVDADEEDTGVYVEEDVANAPRKSLEELTGLRRDQLPPPERLTSEQLQQLLQALKELLSAYNCHVVFQQAGVPENLQYAVIRSRFDQAIPQLRANDHFFSFCDPGQERSSCALGSFCECTFLDNLLSHQSSSEEWEAGEIDDDDFHEYYLRRKYGSDWEKYRYFFDWEETEDDFTDEEDGFCDEEEEW